MSERTRRHVAFARMLSSAVISQALLSVANLVIGLILIRNTSDVQYGSYILASSALLLVVSLQNSIFNPPLAIRLNRLDVVERGKLVGGLYREQQRILPFASVIISVIVLGLWYVHVLDTRSAPLVLATIAAALAILNREYFRMVLLAYRRPHDVLGTDILYAGLIVAGVLVATLTPVPAAGAIVTLGLAAVASGIWLSKILHRYEPWSTQRTPGILRDIAPLALWSSAGAVIHWIFSQGYIFLVASTLDVAAVAAIAATRLLMMPVNLLSTGIGSLMLPLASGWLHRHGASLLFRRLCMLAAALAAVSVCYFAILWLLRDWIFEVVFQKQFPRRDELLMLWGAIMLTMVVCNQLAYLPAALGRFRPLTLITLVSAAVSLACSYWGMLRFGVPGALMGLLAGEILNVLGIVMISLRQTPRGVIAPA